MLDSKFIGRAEPEVKTILENILHTEDIIQQEPLSKLISKEDFDILDIETQRHKFDFVILRKNDVLVIEVNYKHGSKASRKWMNIFVPYLEESKVFPNKKIIPVAINDWDCLTLFKHKKTSINPILITDVVDVCNALITAGVKTIS